MSTLSKSSFGFGFFQHCRIGENSVEITPPFLFGPGCFFSGQRETVTIRKQFLGFTTSEMVLPLSSVFLQVRLEHFRQGPSGDPWGYAQPQSASTGMILELRGPLDLRIKISNDEL